MYNMKATISALAVVLGCFAHTSYAQGTKECGSRQVDSVYLYFLEAGKTKAEAVQLYQTHVEKLKAVAAGDEFKNFEVTSQDLAVSESAYGVDKVDANISINMQFDANYGAVTKMLAQANASGFNSSRHQIETCKE